MNTDEIDKVLIDISRDMDLELKKAKHPNLILALDALMIVAVYGIIVVGILALMHIVFKAL
jgi:hypothetical protein